LALKPFRSFLNQHTSREPAKPLSLPVLGNAASAHQWAAQVSRKTGYRAPLSVESSRKIDDGYSIASGAPSCSYWWS